MATRPRPLSPHLQVYRPMYTMVLSMTHRLTGLALALGLWLLAAWLWALAEGPAAYGRIHGLLASPLGLLLGGAFALAYWYHFCNGLRHLQWDTGRGLEKASARRSGTIVVIATLALTALTLAALAHAGGRP
ncbi:MAG: succinate dehydrogenase, cytochrome b556 subunit [Proteobacteria bacterium]|nr:succinate dehydrogenase, cytochrome b556 subunit [Pseudomonadota bacterium]